MREKGSKFNRHSDLPEIYRQQKGKGSLRLLRVGEEIKRILSEEIERGNTRNPELSKYMVTLTEVVVSPDLRHADVFMTPLKGDHEDISALLTLLKEEAPFLRHLLSKRVTFRYLPELHFKYDTRFLQMEEIDRLFHSAKVQKDLKKE